jgi:phage N-6-adenine-methyltransferase
MNDKERWMTPPEIFDPLMKEFDFDLDAAADAQTHRVEWWMLESLREGDWPGERIWLNPPYGHKLAPFVRRAFTAAQRGVTVVALIPFRCRAAWWHECVIGKAQEVRCIRHRVRFLRPDGTRGDHTMTCDSCLVIWRGSWRGITKLVSA